MNQKWLISVQSGNFKFALRGLIDDLLTQGEGDACSCNN